MTTTSSKSLIATHHVNNMRDFDCVAHQLSKCNSNKHLHQTSRFVWLRSSDDKNTSMWNLAFLDNSRMLSNNEALMCIKWVFIW